MADAKKSDKQEMKHLNTTLINFPKITDPRGNLTVAQSFTDVPFDLKQWCLTIHTKVCLSIQMYGET